MADQDTYRTPRLARAAASGFSHERSTSGTWPGHGVLLVGVPALEGWVRERTAFHDASFVSEDPAFPHAHVTVLAPFPPDALDRAAAIAATTAPFDFTLSRVAAFPDGTIHLVPEPDAGFRALTDAARRLLPEVLPYWGRFEPVPHLTLDRIGPDRGVDSTRASVAGLLPAHGRAEDLVLTWWESGACRVLGRFPLSS